MFDKHCSTGPSMFVITFFKEYNCFNELLKKWCGLRHLRQVPQWSLFGRAMENGWKKGLGLPFTQLLFLMINIYCHCVRSKPFVRELFVTQKVTYMWERMRSVLTIKRLRAFITDSISTNVIKHCQIKIFEDQKGFNFNTQLLLVT